MGLVGEVQDIAAATEAQSDRLQRAAQQRLEDLQGAIWPHGGELLFA